MEPAEKYLEFIKDSSGVAIKSRPIPAGLTDEEEREWRKKGEAVLESGDGFPWGELHAHLKSLR